MIRKGCQVTLVCPKIADSTSISRGGRADFLEDQWFYQKHCLKIMGGKRTVQHINAHHMTGHMPSAFLTPHFQRTLLVALMENTVAHFT